MILILYHALFELISDNVDSPKGKEEKSGKTWKGKMVKKFKRYGSSSNAPVEMLTGNFGVPLDQCVPSTVSEVCFRTDISGSPFWYIVF